MPLGPLRAVCVWPAPKSRFVVSGLLRHEDQKPQCAVRCLGKEFLSSAEHKTCGSQLADECDVSFTFDETALTPIASKLMVPTLRVVTIQ
jgi:hypothetical protein